MQGKESSIKHWLLPCCLLTEEKKSLFINYVKEMNRFAIFPFSVKYGYKPSSWMCLYCCSRPFLTHVHSSIPHAKLSVFQPFTLVFWLPPLQIFLNKCPNLRKKLLVPCVLDPPSANCYVCVSKPEVTVKLNVHKTIVLSLQDRVKWSACFLHRPATMKEMLMLCIHIHSE